jgi:hypothetical protein
MKQFRIALIETVANLTHVYSRTYPPRVGIATLGAILKNLGYSCDVWIKPLSGEERKKLIVGKLQSEFLTRTMIDLQFLLSILNCKTFVKAGNMPFVASCLKL